MRQLTPHTTYPQSTRSAFRPTLVDVAAFAYLAAAGLDVLSRLGTTQFWSLHPFRAATVLFLTGLAVSIFAALTGRVRHSDLATLAVVTLPVLVNVVLRLSVADTRVSPTVTIVILSIVIANLIALSGLFGDLFAFTTPRQRPASARRFGSIRLGGTRYVVPFADGSWTRWQLDARERRN